MYCKNCGKEVDNNEIYCSDCKQKLEKNNFQVRDVKPIQDEKKSGSITSGLKDSIISLVKGIIIFIISCATYFFLLVTFIDFVLEVGFSLVAGAILAIVFVVLSCKVIISGAKSIKHFKNECFWDRVKPVPTLVVGIATLLQGITDLLFNVYMFIKIIELLVGE